MITGIIILFGLVIGSFLNVLIDRIPKGENVVWKPSHCDYCKKPLRWFELLPVVSFVVFGGKCLRCKKRLSRQYPFVEIVTAVGFVYSYHFARSLEEMIAMIAIYCIFLVLFGIDYKHQILPDSLLIALGAITLLLGVWVSPAERVTHSISGVGAGGFFLFIWLFTKGRGLGFGDVKLALILGVLLGYPYIVMSLYIAFLTGAVAGVILMISHKAKMKSRIAFGPFLIIGAMSAYIWGDIFWSIWQRLLL